MKKVSAFIVASGLIFSLNTNAQNEMDAIRYGMTITGATARSIGLGGTGGSWGGDFSSLSINPAGIGVYRNSKMMITPSLQINKANSSYLNNNTVDGNSKMNLNNLGMVFTQSADGRNYDNSSWKTFSVAIGYNRLADFNKSITYEASNNQSSITDIMSADALANGVDDNIAPPLGYLGYQGFLLYDDLYSIPRNNILDQGGSLFQRKEIFSSGGVDDWTLSFGGNYMDKLMLGLSFDMLSYKYKGNTYFSEDDETGDKDNDFSYLDYHESLSSNGLGFNMKFGAIYVVNDYVRIGAAIHTPTWSSLSDLSDYDITTNTEHLKYNTAQSDVKPETYVQPTQPFAFDYNLTTPWKMVLSATSFLGSHGFVTIDYSYVDYASMRYNFGMGSYKEYERSVNQAIKNTFKGGHNLNLGIEGRHDNMNARLGFAYHSSPFIRSNDFGGESIDISAGLGARFNALSLDLGFRHRIATSAEYAYPILASGVVTGIAKTRFNNNLLALTFGYQF